MPAAISSHALPSGSVRAIQPWGASESSMKPVGMRVARLSSPQLSGTREESTFVSSVELPQTT